MRQDMVKSCFKPPYTHRFTAIQLPVLCVLYLWDPCLRSEGPRVKIGTKHCDFFSFLLSPFINPSLPSHRKTHRDLGLKVCSMNWHCIPQDHMTFIHHFSTPLFQNVMFNYNYWITLAVIFLAGTSRVSIFGLIYIVFSFFFMRVGTNILILPTKNVMRR